MNVNYIKLAIIALVIICVTALLMTNHITETTAVAIIGPLCGYLVGNGVTTAQGRTSPPVLSPRKDAV